MSLEIYNKKTKRTANFKTSKKNGLFENPQEFILPPNTFIRTDTKRIITKRTAEKLLRDNKITPLDLLFSDKSLLNPITKKFNTNTKQNTKKYYDITTGQDQTGIDYRIKSYSIDQIPPVNIITASDQELDKIFDTLKNMYFYLSKYKKIPPTAKFQFILFGSSQSGNSISTSIKNQETSNQIGASTFNNNMTMTINMLRQKIKEVIENYEGDRISPDLLVTKLMIRVLNVSTDKFGSYINEEFEILGNKKYRVINPKTINNCLFHSWILGENKKLTYYLNNQDSLINASKILKYKLNPTSKVLSDYETIQELCNYKKRKAVVLDTLFEVKKEFTPITDKNEEPIVLQLVNNHIKACIKWENIEFNKDVPEEDVTIKVKEDANKTIRKFSKDKDFDDKIFVWDIEASRDDNGNFKAYAVGVAYENKYYSWWGLDCLTQFLNFLNDNFEYFNGWTLYAHNGGKFDIPLLLREVLLNYTNFKISTGDIVELNKSFIGFGLQKGEQKIKMKDSLRLLPKSLGKLTEEFKVEHKKLTELVNHNDITLENYNNYKNELEKYLHNDCLGLLEVLKLFSKNVYDDLKINITECYTGASLSKKNYFKNYYNHNETPIFTLNNDIDKFIRDGYGGGRCECFRIGTPIKEKIYYLDFTSLYPYTGCYMLPYNIPTKTNINENTDITLETLNNQFGFWNVLIKTKNYNKKPIHGLKDEAGRFIFPHFSSWTRLNALFTEEIKIGLKNDVYEYKFIEGYNFNKKPFLKKFFTDAFNKKAQAKKEGNTALSECYKIIANSGYGFWGLRCKNRDSIKAFYDDDGGVIPIIQQNKLLDVAQYGKYTFARCYSDLDVKDFNVSIASAISSYARIELWSAINDIESKGGEVYYCDTDSIMTNLNISQHPDLMYKYMRDGCGDALGSLKNECNDKIKNKEILKKQTEIDGFLHFDELIINGCKFYSIKKKLYDGNVIEINKLKGFKQTDDDLLDYDIFEKLANKEIEQIEQIQEQFICPKSNYVSNDKNFGMTIKKVKKEFKIQYNKGKINNSYINPFVL